MDIIRTFALAAAVTAAVAGCQQQDPAQAADAGSNAIERNITTNMDRAMGEARLKLEQENLTISQGGGAPKAEITPQGDLLIDGKAIPLTPAQREATLAYRAQLAGVAAAGMDVGKKGAALAARAVGEAMRGVFSGNPDEVGRRVEAQAEPIRQAAAQLCDRLPALLASQQRLAGLVPQFAPYAKMDASDIDECNREQGDRPMPPTPPASPRAPDAPVKAGNASAQLTAKDVFGKPSLPELPDLPDLDSPTRQPATAASTPAR